MAPEWIWFTFIFAFGACIGSFLNVVIYRLPRDKSLVTPPSACPKCDTPIRFYDNIPLFSWLILGGKCRTCRAPISIRYFIVELLTAMMFGLFYVLIFYIQYRQTGFAGELAMQRFFWGGWFFYLNIMVLVAAFMAGSAIDLELWIIPLELCWFVTLIGLLCATISPLFISEGQIVLFKLFPVATAKTGSIAVGMTVGLVISLGLLFTGVIKSSYEMEKLSESDDDEPQKPETEPDYNDRLEMVKELVFLAPVVIGGIVAYQIFKQPVIAEKWQVVVDNPYARGFLGSLAGYFAGCGVVWTTRILGTLAFNKEAMGLGDVHLMGAAGAVIGGLMTVLSFFIAPFFGLLWALYQLFVKKSRQIPYGPFLSLGVFVVIIFHDRIREILADLYGF